MVRTRMRPGMGPATGLAALCLLGFALPPAVAAAATPNASPLGIGIEGWPYPYPVRMFPVTDAGQSLRMAYMDVLPAPTVAPNGRTAVLLHGKNFSSDYWAGVIADLAGRGYRVVVPDQVGFNKSSKPDMDYSFDALAANTLALLDHLGVAGPVDLIGHSTGGMLAVGGGATPPPPPRPPPRPPTAWRTTASPSRRRPPRP